MFFGLHHRKLPVRMKQTSGSLSIVHKTIQFSALDMLRPSSFAAQYQDSAWETSTSGSAFDITQTVFNHPTHDKKFSELL
jgi:hypothetical protein